MIPVIPSYIAMVLVAADITIATAIWGELSRAARRSDLPPGARRGVRIGAAVFLGGWLSAVLALAPTAASVVWRDPYYITPLIPLFVGVSIITALVALWRSSPLRRVVAAVPVAVLHALQSWRVLGVVFVFLFTRGQLPAHFALPAGWGDIGIGLTAPLVALALARGARGATGIAAAWNIVGLIDLVVAVGMGTGVLAALLAPEMGGRVPPAAAMGTFPMILVPTFAVPLSVLLHVLSLARLRGAVHPRPQLVPTGAR